MTRAPHRAWQQHREFLTAIARGDIPPLEILFQRHRDDPQHLNEA
jgi:hypothetical protein